MPEMSFEEAAINELRTAQKSLQRLTRFLILRGFFDSAEECLTFLYWVDQFLYALNADLLQRYFAVPVSNPRLIEESTLSALSGGVFGWLQSKLDEYNAEGPRE